MATTWKRQQQGVRERHRQGRRREGGEGKGARKHGRERHQGKRTSTRQCNAIQYNVNATNERGLFTDTTPLRDTRFSLPHADSFLFIFSLLFTKGLLCVKRRV